uniref:Alpha-glucosidase n=1 Tax=Kalanchoe fedtschenkoi TaxID=63787 RepID=A0A7N0VHB9_KALFE
MSSSSFYPLLVIFSILTTCWGVKASDSSSKPPEKIGAGYCLLSVEETGDGGLLGLLEVNKKNSVYGSDIKHLQLYIKHETEQRLRVHITDATKPRWEVPYNLLPRSSPPSLKKALPKSTKRKAPSLVTPMEYSGSELIFSFTTNPFGFAVRRKSNNDVLFNTTAYSSSAFNNLIFKDQYLEVSTSLPSSASLYGLGENTQPHGIKIRPKEPYTLYTTDASAINLNTDLYGAHPVYMDLRNLNGKAFAHGVLLLNSNGMDVVYRGDSLTYKVIGGVLDFFFFAGESPLAVVDQYTELIGRPAPMPYWAFGFHQCRWGYHNLSVVEDVVANYEKAKIPLDVIWNDDDHMDFHKDFTLNPIAYPRQKLEAFLDRIHSKGMKYIVLIDPGIAVNSSYGVYNRAMADDVFIKYEGEPYLAQVWPGAVYFPDFLNPKTVTWWGDEIKRFHEMVPVDGLWIDMNEASNFCSGKCVIPQGIKCPSVTGPGWECCLDCKNITKTRWDDPPYKINASGKVAPIGFKTIATSASHYNGVLEYDAHSIYGFSQAVATHKALESLQGKRPFILSRSTFVGSGKYAAHWTGDNQGTWNDLRYSISTMLNFGIFGVPMVGSDICGFYPQPTEELCNRWIELGAFYPFSRDHANYYSPRQELYQWATVAESARNALGMRYKLLPYLYSLSFEAHVSGAPIARPLFFTFPNYVECYGLSTQFLLGRSVMVSPVLEQGATNVTALFPPGSWYSMFDMSHVVNSKEGANVTLDAPLHVVNVHVYQNSIIPMQQGGLISKEARMTPFTLVVTFPVGAEEGDAEGSLFLDEDELPEMKLGNDKSTLVSFYATLNKKAVKVWSKVQEGDFALTKGWAIEKLTVLGLDGVIAAGLELMIDGNPVLDLPDVEITTTDLNFVAKDDEDATMKSLMVEIKGLNIPVGKDFAMSWKMGFSG